MKNNDNLEFILNEEGLRSHKFNQFIINLLLDKIFEKRFIDGKENYGTRRDDIENGC
jgi:hypothetical protein